MATCKQCSRTMIIRKAWRAMTEAERTVDVACAGAKGYCATHYQAYGRSEGRFKRPAPLDEAELVRLRRAVGLT